MLSRIFNQAESGGGAVRVPARHGNPCQITSPLLSDCLLTAPAPIATFLTPSNFSVHTTVFDSLEDFRRKRSKIVTFCIVAVQGNLEQPFTIRRSIWN